MWNYSFVCTRFFRRCRLVTANTSIYARGKRLEFLKKNGLLYKKKQNIKRAEITILGELPDNDIYDFILLTVRENQLYEALSELKNNKSDTIVTMVNSLDSYKKWEDIVGKGRRHVDVRHCKKTIEEGDR